MKRYLTLFMVCLMWLQLTPVHGATIGTNSTPSLNTVDFWLKSPTNDAIILQPDQIKSFNQQLKEKSSVICDLATYPTTVTGENLKQLLTIGNVLNGTLYANGKEIDDQYRQSLIKNCNLDKIQAQNSVSYGVVVRRTNLRTLPTLGGLFESSDDHDFDNLQETAVDPAEPVVILHSSLNGDFQYVQMRNYHAWIPTKDIAVTTRTNWLNYVNPAEFLIVSDHRYTLAAHNEQIVYQMGAKIPLKKVTQTAYSAILPIRSADGTLQESIVKISPNSSVHLGFLPYTRNQIITQAFKFLGDPYGWGGLKNSVDCSSFIQCIYRSMGIELPRNTGEQETTAGITIPLGDLNPAAKDQAFKNLQSGDVLYLKGHAMLYLGQANGQAYIMHAFAANHVFAPDGSHTRVPVMQVIISDLNLHRASGQTLAEAIRTAKVFH